MTKKWEDRKKDENTNYRGGNTGILLDGVSAGECIRKALARSLGKYTVPDWDKQLMFDVGELNEVRWDEYLVNAGLDIRSGEQLSSVVQWSTDQGTPVTGTPDCIVYEEGKPALGIEHKHISSFNSAMSAISGQPQLKHVAQAAHYSMIMNIPFTIMYTSSTNITGPDWRMKGRGIPKPGQQYSEHCDYTYYKLDPSNVYVRGKNKGKPKPAKITIDPTDAAALYPQDIMKKYKADKAELKNFRPFAIEFPLKFVGGVVHYYNGTDWVETIVSKENIRDFYNTIDVIKSTQQLGPRPYTLDVHGESMPFTSCDYCELKKTCDKHEHNYSDWVQDLLSNK